MLLSALCISKFYADELEDFRNMDIESAIQIVVLKLISLSIDDDEDDGAESGMKLPCKTENGMIVPYKEKLKPPKVLLDPQTLKVWNRTMFPEDGEALDPDEEEQWKHERELFSGRVDSFIARMHLTLGTCLQLYNHNYKAIFHSYFIITEF